MLKKENPLTKERTKLLKMLQQMNVTTRTKLEVGRKFENMSDVQAEQYASQLFRIIKICDTEEGILNSIKQL